MSSEPYWSPDECAARATPDLVPAHHVLTWDWRAQPDLERLGRLVNELSGGQVHLVEAETGDDQYALVVANVPMTDVDAAEAYRAHERGDHRD